METTELVTQEQIVHGLIMLIASHKAWSVDPRQYVKIAGIHFLYIRDGISIYSPGPYASSGWTGLDKDGDPYPSKDALSASLTKFISANWGEEDLNLSKLVNAKDLLQILAGTSERYSG